MENGTLVTDIYVNTHTHRGVVMTVASRYVDFDDVKIAPTLVHFTPV